MKRVTKSYDSRTAFTKDIGDMRSKGYWLREAKWVEDGIVAKYLHINPKKR